MSKHRREQEYRATPPLAFKPDMADAAKRWNAYFAGQIIDRPLVTVTAPKEGKKGGAWASYKDRVFGDMDVIIANALTSAEATFYGGEAIPAFGPSFGPDEIAVFCGGEDFRGSQDSEGTNWSVPFVDDWSKSLPLRLRPDNPLWKRMLQFYSRAADKMAGKMMLTHLDLHTNMDLLAAVRGPERLCMDLIDQPETIDRAMASARAVFPIVWDAIAEAGRMDERGHCSGIYSPDGAAILQCDFICMMGPELFRRWVLPALEEEAAIVKHTFWHWDGPGALKHARDILSSRGLHTMGYVPTVGPGGRIKHIECLDLLKTCQKAGKAVQAVGTPDEVRAMHKELKPELAMYCTNTATQAEAEGLLKWFVKNT